jgi:type II secretory pathway component PulJ
MKQLRAGIGLIEILIAMAILSIVSWAVISIWMSGQRAYDVAEALAQAQAEARRAMVGLEQEMRAASRSNITIGTSELSFQTILPNQTSFSSVRYLLGSETIQGVSVPVLYREAPAGSGTQRRVASHISTFSNTYNPATEDLRALLTITVEDRSATLSTTVRPRNP